MTTAPDLRTVLRNLPWDAQVRGYFADMRLIDRAIDGRQYGGFLLFVFECPFGVRGKDYGT